MEDRRDFLNRPIALGDYVVFPGAYNGGMKLGKIVKFTPQKVRIEHPGWSWKNNWGMITPRRAAGQCVRVEGPDLRLAKMLQLPGSGIETEPQAFRDALAHLVGCPCGTGCPACVGLPVLRPAQQQDWDGIKHTKEIPTKDAARFLLVGTMNPEEGELRPQLLDRFGLVVEARTPRDPALRAEVVRRQVDAGVVGLTVATIGEAEALFEDFALAFAPERIDPALHVVEPPRSRPRHHALATRERGDGEAYR